MTATSSHLFCPDPSCPRRRSGMRKCGSLFSTTVPPVAPTDHRHPRHPPAARDLLLTVLNDGLLTSSSGAAPVLPVHRAATSKADIPVIVLKGSAGSQGVSAPRHRLTLDKRST
jgi:hypothetical protein